MIYDNRPGQVNWRRCTKCNGPFLGPNAVGVCPSGGAHDPSGAFLYQFDPRSNPPAGGAG